MKRRSWAWLGLLLCASVAQAEPRPSGGCVRPQLVTGRPVEKTFEIDGVKRRLLLDAPETLEPGKPVPVLFDFHGWGHSADGVWEVSRFRDFAPDEKFLTVYPDGLPVALRGDESKPGWQIRSLEGNRDIAFTRVMLDWLETEYCVDRARVYSTGFSNGAFFSHLLACSMADRFAAIAPVGGGRILVPCRPSAPMPVQLHHGEMDAVVPIDEAVRARDQWVSLNECMSAEPAVCERHVDCKGDVVVEFCRAPVAHQWPEPATKRIWEFLKKYERRG